MKDFKVILSETSARADDFRAVFGRLEVCIQSPLPRLANLPGFDVPQRVYLLDLDALTEAEEARLVQHISTKLNVGVEDVILHLHNSGVPILADECVVVVDHPQRWMD